MKNLFLDMFAKAQAEDNLVGLLITVNSIYFQMNTINDEGDEDGLSTYKIEDIQRVFGDGSDERKAEFFYQNRKKLNK